jgi:hypothetical protein
VVCLLIEGLHALRSVETPVFWVLESGGGRPRSLLPTRPTAALTCRNRPTLAPRAINPSYQGCRCHATPAQRQQDAALLHKRRPLRGPVDHSETEANDCACLYDSRGGACPALCRPCPRVFPDPFHAWSTPGRDLDVPTIIAVSTPPDTVFSVPGHGGGEANAFRHGRLDPIGPGHQCLVWLVALAAWIDGWGWPRPVSTTLPPTSTVSAVPRAASGLVGGLAHAGAPRAALPHDCPRIRSAPARGRGC